MRLGTHKKIDKQVLSIEVQPVAPTQPANVQPVLFDVPAKVIETDEDQLNYKVDDRAFWQCMRRALGNCSKAARLLKKEYDIEISRQAVNARANRNPDLLAECKEILLDTAEEVMMNLLLGGDKKVAADMAKHITKTLGKGRGYTEKTETSTEVTIKSVRVELIENTHRFAIDESEIDDAE